MVPFTVAEIPESANSPEEFSSGLWRMVSNSSNIIVPFNENGDGPALYVVHPIFGDVSNFRGLSEALGVNRRFYGIQAPKKNMTAEFAASIEEIARYYVEKLIAFQPSGPFVIAGWSAGAVIALEMAQQLLALGREVPFLIALDGAPCNTGGGLSRTNPLYIVKLILNLPGWFKFELKQQHSWTNLFKQIVSKIAIRTQINSLRIRNEQTLSGADIEDVLTKPGLPKSQVVFIRALYSAMRAYVPKDYTGHVLVYEARTQPLYHMLQVGAAWSRIAKRLEIVRLKGNHGSIFQKPSVTVVAHHLNDHLSRLTAATED